MSEKSAEARVVEKIMEDIHKNNASTEERVQTIEEIEAEKKEQIAVLGASDAENCSFSQGYCKRQALYACLTCAKDGQPAAMCLACSYNCHDDCDLVELYTKRNFRCDCGTGKYHRKCKFDESKNHLNDENKYDFNFDGKYCQCRRPYPDPECPEDLKDAEMIQCILCEDWWHDCCLKLTKEELDNEDNDEMICPRCLCKPGLSFLRCYSISNTQTEIGTAECTKPINEPKSESGSFFFEDFRLKICKCVACMKLITDAKIEFLCDYADSVAAYEQIGIDAHEEEEKQADGQINNFLDKLDHNGQMEVAHGVSFMRQAMKEMCEKAQSNGGVITAEHTAELKRKLAERTEEMKRRRLNQ